mmetsp:Transcript_45433/g.141132  ORF Transcript_45433/g.141132 Transcript_45433/m.141132 type:complete len:391 (+) Transcript_45433:3169-4341(+)
MRQVEESSLHDVVGQLAQSAVLCDLAGIDNVEFDVLVGYLPLHIRRQALLNLLERGPRRVEHEGAPLFHVDEHVQRVDVTRERARDVVGGFGKRQVRRLQALGPEAHVRDRRGTRLDGAVREVGLRLEVAVVADDLHSVLVRTDSTIACETVEHALPGGLRHTRVQLLPERGQARKGHVVLDADGEAVLPRSHGVLEDRRSHGGGVLLGAEAVAAAKESDAGKADVFLQRGAQVEEERLAERAVLLGAVQHCHGFHRRRQKLCDLLAGPGAEKHGAEHADLLALGLEMVEHGLRDPHRAAHLHDDVLGIRVALVSDQAQGATRDLAYLLHRLLDDIGKHVVVHVCRFDSLHVHIGILVAAAHHRCKGRQTTPTVTCQSPLVDEAHHVINS